MRRAMIMGMLVPAALTLGACGGDDGSDGNDGKKRAEPKPAGACRYDEKTLLPAMKKAVPAKSSARISMEMSGPGTDLAMDAVMAYRPGGTDVKMTSHTAGQEFSMIAVGDRLFVSESAAGDGYKEVRQDDPVAAEIRSQVTGVDPRSTFAAFEAGLEKVVPVGEEQIDGDQVCHYTLTIDTAAAAEAKGDPLNPASPKQVVYGLFLTPDDLMRRITFDVQGVSARVDATHWGEPVDIEVPPLD